MGNVVKRGSVYYIRYEGPQHADGRRNQKFESCRGMNKRQCEEHLRMRESEVHNGIYVEDQSITLSAWFQSWIARKANSLSPTTIEDYEQKFNTHIIPKLGHITVQKLRPIMIQNLLDSLLKKVSAKTVRNITGCFHSCLSDAVTLGVVQFNPADNLILPAKTRPDIKLPESGDLDRMLDALEGTPYRLPFLLVVGTGMRRGEVIGLKWEDFKAETRTLIVARAIVQTRGAITVKLPKSGRTRVILLPINLIEELQQHKKAQEANGYTGEWIVNTNAGDRMTPGSFGCGVALARRRAGVKASLHSWRHDQATTLLMAGVPAKVVSERLGHSTINITQDIYAHVLPTMQAPAVDILDAKWAKYYEEKKGSKAG